MHKSNIELRVGYTPMSGQLYAGLVRRDNGKWEGEPQEVTSWALYAVAQKLLWEGLNVVWCLPDGKVVRLSAEITNTATAEVPDVAQ